MDDEKMKKPGLGLIIAMKAKNKDKDDEKDYSDEKYTEMAEEILENIKNENAEELGKNLKNFITACGE
jgi:predicted metal-dependent hydrolase